MNDRNTLNRFPLSLALDYIANYKNHVRGLGVTDVNIIKAYLVSYEDVVETYGIPVNNTGARPTYSYMRVYIGMKDTDDAHTHEYKLFLVPVIVNDEFPDGKDIIPNGPVDNGGESIDYVYDFNTPCPNTCDTSSPLYLAGQPR